MISVEEAVRLNPCSVIDYLTDYIDKELIYSADVNACIICPEEVLEKLGIASGIFSHFRRNEKKIMEYVKEAYEKIGWEVSMFENGTHVGYKYPDNVVRSYKDTPKKIILGFGQISLDK